MWFVIAILYALVIVVVFAMGSLWLVIAGLLKAKDNHARRLLTLELEADLPVDRNSIAAGVTNMNRMPWRIRAQWWWERQTKRVKGWKK